MVVLGGSRSSRHKEQLAEHVQVATRMSPAFSGNAYVQQIVMGEVSEFVQRYRGSTVQPVDLAPCTTRS